MVECSWGLPPRACPCSTVEPGGKSCGSSGVCSGVFVLGVCSRCVFRVCVLGCAHHAAQPTNTKAGLRHVVGRHLGGGGGHPTYPSKEVEQPLPVNEVELLLQIRACQVAGEGKPNATGHLQIVQLVLVGSEADHRIGTGEWREHELPTHAPPGVERSKRIETIAFWCYSEENTIFENEAFLSRSGVLVSPPRGMRTEKAGFRRSGFQDKPKQQNKNIDPDLVGVSGETPGNQI